MSPENIILYGQSIGTVPTVDLAARYEVGAVILHSALMSGMRVAFPQTNRTWFFDAFPRYVHSIRIFKNSSNFCKIVFEVDFVSFSTIATSSSSSALNALLVSILLMLFCKQEKLYLEES